MHIISETVTWGSFFTFWWVSRNVSTVEWVFHSHFYLINWHCQGTLILWIINVYCFHMFSCPIQYHCVKNVKSWKNGTLLTNTGSNLSSRFFFFTSTSCFTSALFTNSIEGIKILNASETYSDKIMPVKSWKLFYTHI